MNGLTDEFGIDFYPAILSWCGLLDEYDKNNFWQVWLIKYVQDKANEETIGMCGIYSLSEETEELWLGWFGLIKEYRNKSIGTIVLKELEKIANMHKCKSLYAYVDGQGKPLPFYQRNGYEVLGRAIDIKKEKEIDFMKEDDWIIKKELK